jgi:hypothetical protein
MKKALINTLAAVVALAGLAASCIAPWWAVWLVAFPVIYAGAVTLIKMNTDYIENC